MIVVVAVVVVIVFYYYRCWFYGISVHSGATPSTDNSSLYWRKDAAQAGRPDFPTVNLCVQKCDLA